MNKPIRSELKTSSYTILIISLLTLLSVCLPIQAQQPEKRIMTKEEREKVKQEEKKEAKEIVPLYNGAFIGVDLFGIGSNLFGGDFLSSEINLKVNLKNKFLPTLELGYGTTDTWNDTGIHYKSSAPYFRIGADYNTMAKKKDKNSFLYVGLRYGLSSFKYDITSLPAYDPIYGGAMQNPSLVDGIWGGSLPYDYKGLKSTMHWFELVAGVHVRVFSDFYMGWALRLKYKISASMSEHGNPWYVPGFGAYKSNNIGVTYTLIYKLPL